MERIEQVAAAQEISSGSEEVSAAVEQTATMNEIANAANDLQGLVEDLNAATKICFKLLPGKASVEARLFSLLYGT